MSPGCDDAPKHFKGTLKESFRKPLACLRSKLKTQNPPGVMEEWEMEDVEDGRWEYGGQWGSHSRGQVAGTELLQTLWS